MKVNIIKTKKKKPEVKYIVQTSVNGDSWSPSAWMSLAELEKLQSTIQSFIWSEWNKKQGKIK